MPSSQFRSARNAAGRLDPDYGRRAGRRRCGRRGARLINKTTHQYANPVRYRTGIRVLIALGVVPLFYLSLPINVAPVVIPVWFFAAAGTVIVVMVKAQHRI